MRKARPKPQLFSSLDPWLERKASLPPPDAIAKATTDNELGGWIGLEMRAPLHEAAELDPQSLNDSWNRVSSYLERAMTIIDSDSPGWLDRDEAEMIREELGEPPPRCLPLYFISVGTGATERLVYVGRTSASVSRFKNGHTAITRLHAPEYDGLPKQIYLASVTLLAEEGVLEESGNYLPLEWITPFARAERFLSSIENAVIYDCQPPLNTMLKRAYRPSEDVSLMIQNFCEGSEFLNNYLVDPLPSE